MIDPYLQQAEAHYWRGETRQAVDLLLTLIGSFPEDLRGYLALADLMRDLGQPENAVDVLKEVPETVRNLRWEAIMALALIDIGDRGVVVAAVERLLSDASTRATGFLAKGRLAASSGDMDGAKDFLKQAVAADLECGEAMTCLGRLMWQAGDTVSALEMLGRGLSATPWRSESATLYHEAVRTLDAFDHAESVFQGIFEVAPGIERTTCLYIDVLLRRGDLPRAFGVAQRALAVLGASDGLLDGALAIQRQLGEGSRQPEAPLLSLCMIVRDEQFHLARCLHSVAPLVDEMVIVDTGSVDRSMDVARVFGATVVAVPWAEDFAAARNVGLALASGKWILVMDADEAISLQDHDALRQLLTQVPAETAAFTFTTRNYVHEMNALGWQPNNARYSAEAAGNGWFPSEKVRLFSNLATVRFSYPVHELVEPDLKAAGIAVHPCPVPIHHYGKIDRNRAAEKGEAYFQIGLQKVEDMAGDPLALRELAVQAMNLERYQDAVSLWQRLIQAGPPNAETLVNLSSAHWHCGNYLKARDCARQALDLAPGIKEAAYNLANSLMHLGASAEAVDVLAPIMDRHPDYLAGRFLMAAALCCSGQGARGASALLPLKETVLGAGLPLSCATLVDSLVAAGQRQSARLLADGAAAGGCGTAEVHELAVQGASRFDAPVLGVVAS